MPQVKPLSPDDMTLQQREAIPDFVIEVFNRLLSEKWDGHQAVVTQEAAVAAIMARWTPPNSEGMTPDTKRQKVFESGWLDVEILYREQGWDVTYDKPSRGDNYFETHFIFKRKR